MLHSLKWKVLHGGNLPPIKELKGCHPKGFWNLVTVEDSHTNKVTLQAVAARSFLKVRTRLEDQHIPLLVASSFRTCAQQEQACNNVCGAGCKGCPGTCAPCGESWHGSGLAVDFVTSGKKIPYGKVDAAFAAEGWHCFSKTTDPNHRSYRVTG